MRLALALPLLAGCDILFQLRDVKSPPDGSREASIDAPARCMFSDNFDDNMLSPQWRLDEPTHTGALVTEKSGRLDIQLRATTVGYNGILSVERQRFTGRSLQATAFPMSQAGHVETYMQIIVDSDNELFMHTGVGNMTFATRIAGVVDKPLVGYDETQHRYWRMRHDAVAGVVHFEVSGNADDPFTIARTAVVPFSLDSATIKFWAGTFSLGNPDPGAARYDDVMLCDPLD